METLFTAIFIACTLIGALILFLGLLSVFLD